MTHAELAKALKLSRPTISRDVKKGMPLDVSRAKEWRDEHKEFRGEKTGPKAKDRVGRRRETTVAELATPGTARVSNRQADVLS